MQHKKSFLSSMLLCSLTGMGMLLGACSPQGTPSAAPNPSPSGTPGKLVVETAVNTTVGIVAESLTPTAPLAAALPSPSGTSPQMPKTLQELGYSVKTFHDPVSGLAFDYPAGWILNAPSDEQKKAATIYTITLRSAEVTPAPKQQEGLPAGLTAIDIGIYQPGAKTLAQAIAERRKAAAQPETGEPLQVQAEEDWKLGSGLQAHRFLFDLGPTGGGTPGPDRMSSELVTLIGSRVVLVDGQGDQALFNLIAASLREER
jgi:hypothetical protein